ncbi:glycosyltransferase family 4 protein [Weissella soli]|uniref:glycosyltransferase n=1 Tax=Weissella soli TaxID=155866 RepID=UPI0021C0C23C|nr:glycosyltransferase [Weissella soli]MCT8395395.1 glycosyltransferase family 4 protein [Weissella soli]
MNIGIFTDTYYPQLSGVLTSIKTLTAQLEAHGHHVYIFTTTDPSLEKGIAEPNVYRFSSVPFVGFKERRISYRGAIQGIIIARKLKLDIVHTQTEFSIGLMGKSVASALKIPAVHTYHTNYEDYTHYVFNGKVFHAGAVALLARGFTHGMTAVIAPSKQTYETLARYKVAPPLEIIPTGVKVDFTSTEDHSTALRESLGFTPETPVALVLGRVAFEKNIEAVLENFKWVLEDMPKARLVVAGNGPALDAIENHAKALEIDDAVTFTGYVDHEQAYSYYRMADVFVSASTTETQGLTYIEAITAGKPIVAMDSLYLRDIVIDEAIGTLVSETYEIADVLLKYLTAKTEALELGDPTIRQQILHEIDERTFGQRVIDLYNEALAVYQDNATEAENQAADDEYVRSFRLRNPFRKES